MSYFSHKTIWITGASSGIGEGLAKALDYENTTLILSGRRLAELQRVASGMQKARVILAPFDISDRAAGQKAVTEVLAQTGQKLDILVNNAGISQRALAQESKIEVDEQLMLVNYISQVFLTKLLLPALKQSSSGQIVVISSVMGKMGTPYRSGYAASKHALHGYFNSLRAELHQTPVQVTLICPGFVRTPITMHALTGDGSPLNQMDKGTDKGINPDRFAQKVLRAVSKRKNEAVIAGKKEKFGIFMSRFFPAVYAKLITKISVR
ncbi:MAG: SDR family oxidoreductase [Flavobacteriales bacterium]